MWKDGVTIKRRKYLDNTAQALIQMCKCFQIPHPFIAFFKKIVDMA